MNDDFLYNHFPDNCDQGEKHPDSSPAVGEQARGEKEGLMTNKEWNSPSNRAVRLSTLSSLFNKHSEIQTTVRYINGIMSKIPDMDIHLLNRDLGWTSQAALISKFTYVPKGASLLSENGRMLEDTFFISSRVVRSYKDVPNYFNSLPDAGDFRIMIEATGSLVFFKVRRVAIAAVPTPVGMEFTTGLPKTNLNLFSDDINEERSRTAAGIADSIIKLMQFAPTLSQKER